jgi:PAS domain S-box-containing protein
LSHSDPARANVFSGISEPKSHSPNVFAAPIGDGREEKAVAHHEAPVFGAGPHGSRPDWPAVLDELPFGLIVLGPNQELRHENSACRQLAGHSIADKGGVEGWLSALCPKPSHRENIIASWREKIWRTQRTLTFTLRTADQKQKEVEFRSSLLPDGGIAIVLEDVTETTRSQESSRLGKLRFRALFSHTRTGTVLVDPSGRIIDANPAFLALCGNSFKELRLSTFAGLLHPDEAAALAAEERALLAAWPEQGEARGSAPRSVEREVWLRTRGGERRLRLVWCPLCEAPGPPRMALYLFETIESEGEGARLRNRLKTVARKAQALLNSVPDLVLLLDEDGVVVDFAPPPQPWAELTPDESWRNRPASEVWPVLGSLLARCRHEVATEGGSVSAEIRGPGSEGFEFAVNLSGCGDGQILAVVRNQGDRRAARERELWQAAAFEGAPLGMLRLDALGRVAEANPAAAALLGGEPRAIAGCELSPLLDARLPEGATAQFLSLEQDGQPRGSLVFLQDPPPPPPPPSPAPPQPAPLSRPLPLSSVIGTGRERGQHGFRNQLQLVTSLFSLEPQSAAAREAFLKWQVRLRSIAIACPYDDSPLLWVHPLLCDLADEVCSLVGKGPGRREVLVTGDDGLTLDSRVAGPFSLLLGEIMRLVLATRQPGPGASLHIHLRPEADGGFRLTVRPGERRTFVFTDRDAEIETLELLTEQIQGRLEPTDAAHPSKEWVLIVPPVEA